MDTGGVTFDTELHPPGMAYGEWSCAALSKKPLFQESVVAAAWLEDKSLFGGAYQQSHYEQILRKIDSE